MATSLPEIRSELQAIFRKELHNPEMELRFEMRVGALEGDDVETDAHDALLHACEEHWGVEFSDSEIRGIRTVRDLADAILAKT